ncbi:MAG: hypothetical protein AB7E79_12075 [Rhodospirillaceae bacterium]
MKIFAAVLVPLALVAGAAAAADRTCFQLSQIDESPVIDDSTILLKMKNGDFQRVDIAGRCPSLKMSGFAHKTPSDDFCTSTVLTVRSPDRASCMIERIVEIDRAEADQLMAKK